MSSTNSGAESKSPSLTLSSSPNSLGVNILDPTTVENMNTETFQKFCNAMEKEKQRRMEELKNYSLEKVNKGVDHLLALIEDNSITDIITRGWITPELVEKVKNTSRALSEIYNSINGNDINYCPTTPDTSSSHQTTCPSPSSRWSTAELKLFSQKIINSNNKCSTQDMYLLYRTVYPTDNRQSKRSRNAIRVKCGNLKKIYEHKNSTNHPYFATNKTYQQLYEKYFYLFSFTSS